MRRTSRRLTSRRPRPRGFTLIEAVFALAIAALLCGAVAAGLTVVHRERQDTLRCRELSLALRGITARRALEPKAFADGTNTSAAVNEESAKTEVRDGERRKVWEVWSASAADRPSRRVRLGFPDVPARTEENRNREPDRPRGIGLDEAPDLDAPLRGTNAAPAATAP